MQIMQQAKKLFAALLDQLPLGHSFIQLQTELHHGLDSAELRQENATFILTFVKLRYHLKKHFKKPKQNKTEIPKSVLKAPF